MKKLNKMIKKIDAFDISLIKISVVATTLLVVKFVPQLTSLEWYLYVGIFILAVIRPMKYCFVRKK